MRIGRFILMPILAIAVTAGQVGAAWQWSCVFACCQSAQAEVESHSKPACCQKKQPSCCRRSKTSDADDRLPAPVTQVSQPCRCAKAPQQPSANRPASKQTRVTKTASLVSSNEQRVRPSMSHRVLATDDSSDLPPPGWVRNCVMLL